MAHIQEFRGGRYPQVQSQVYNGRAYDSKFEASVAKELDTLRKAANPRERVVDVEPQHKVEIRSPITDKLICRYYVDFRVEYADGHIELIEAKGHRTEVFRLKLKLLEQIWLPQHPEVEYRIIQQRADKDWARAQRKKQRQKLKDWGAKRGLKPRY